MVEQDYLLLAPGPVQLHPRVREILAEPMIHHRTPEFDKILQRVLMNLKKVFETQQNVFIHTSTGSGGMESLLVNTLKKNDNVLAIVGGKFGERWAQMAKAYGCHVDEIKVPWGEKFSAKTMLPFLAQKSYAAVLCQATETSCASAFPIAEIGQTIKSYPQTLFLVDGITAVGAYDLPMDQLGIDGLVAGSQKAFMIPAGLSFVSLSQKAWKVCETNPTPRYYFDLRLEAVANKKGETHFSSPVSLIKALDFVLMEYNRVGLQNLHQQIHRRAEMTRYFVKLLGLKLYSQMPSDSVTAILLPDFLDGQKIRQDLENQFKISIMGGQDQAKGKILRVGHMGFIQDSDMLNFFSSLMLVLEKAHQLNQKPNGDFVIDELKRKNILKEMQTWQQKKIF